MNKISKLFSILVAMVMVITTLMPITTLASEDGLVDFNNPPTVEGGTDNTEGGLVDFNNPPTVEGGTDNTEGGETPVGEANSGTSGGGIEFIEDPTKNNAVDNTIPSNESTEGENPPAAPENNNGDNENPPPVPDPVVETKEETSEESIPFETAYQDDETRIVGEPDEIIQAGSNGVKTLVYNVTYTDGVETGRELISESVTLEPVTQIIGVASKQPDPDPVVIEEEIDIKDALTFYLTPNPKDTGISNGTATETKATMKTEKDLDRIRVSFAATNLSLNTISFKSFSNAGVTTITVYKRFNIRYEDEKKVVHSEDVEVPLTEVRSASESFDVSNLDMDYSSWGNAIEDATAEFLGDYVIEFNTVSANFSGNFFFKATMNSAEKENAKIRASASYSFKDAKQGVWGREATYTYAEPDINPDDNPEENKDGEGKSPEGESEPPMRGLMKNGPLLGDPIVVDTGNVILTVIEKDSNPEVPVAGVVFSLVSTEEGSTAVDATTNNDGKAQWTDLAPGSYTFSTKTIPQEYKQAAIEGSLTVAAGIDTESTISLEKAPTTGSVVITVIEKDSDPEVPVAGVVFSLVSADEGATAVDATTGNDGKAEWTDLAPGTYTINSKTIPQEYKQAAITGSFTVVAGAESATTYYLEKASTTGIVILTVIEKDSDPEVPVAGVVFSLVPTEEGSTAVDATTGNDGKAEWTDLAPGSYTFSTKTIPQEYKQATIEGTLTVTAGVETKSTIELEKASTTGSVVLTVIEKDSDPEVPVAGVVFSLVSTEEGSTAVDATTGNDGKAEWTNLAPGTYTYSSKTIPQEYSQATIEGSLTVTAGVETKSTINLEKATTAGSVVVTVIEKGSDPKVPVAGVVFSLVSTEEGSTAVDATTNNDGKAQWTDLAPGSYTFSSKTIPPEYKQAAIEGSLTVTAGVETESTIELEKATTTGSVVVTVIEKGSDPEVPVADVVFSLVSTEEGSTAVDATTNNDGKAQWTDLAPGTYKFSSRTIPQEYKQVSISGTLTVTAEEPTSLSIELEKAPTTGKIIVSVTCTEGDVVTPVKGATVSVGKASEETGEQGTTDDNGLVTFAALDPGSYIVTIDSMPEGYEDTYNPLTVTVEAGKDATAKFDAEKKPPIVVTFKVVNGKWNNDTTDDYKVSITAEHPALTNDDIPPVGEKPAEGYVAGDWDVAPVAGVVTEDKTYTYAYAEKPLATLVIEAVDSVSEEAIGGIDFVLTAEGKDPVRSTTDTTSGLAVFKVDPGTYTASVDASTLPEGYTCTYSETVELTTDAPKNSKAELENHIGMLKLTVIDKVTKDPVSKVKFGIKKESEETSDTYETNNEGIISLNLLADVYSVSIVGLPEEYANEENEYNTTFTIEAGKVKEDTIELLANSTPETGKIVITVTNIETGGPVEGVAFLVTAEGATEGEEYVTLDDGKATILKNPGKYNVKMTSYPSAYQETVFDENIELNRGDIVERAVTLTPEETPEDIHVVSLTGLSFDPEEQEIVPTSKYTASLEGYALTLSKEGAIADQVKFAINPVTPAVAMEVLFDGTCSAYRICAVNKEGVAKTVASAASEAGVPCVLSFNSKDLPVIDPETGEPIPGAEGAFPEGTEFVWIIVEEPSADFAVNTFNLYATAPESFTEIEYTAETSVTVGTDLPKKAELTGSIISGLPKGELTISASASKLKVGNAIVYTVNFTNTTQTVYKTVTLDIAVSNIFSPKNLTPGTWEGYTGKVDVYAVDNNDQPELLCTIDTSETNKLMLNGESIKAIRFVTKAEVAGDINIKDVKLDGTFTEAGKATAHAAIVGTVTKDVSLDTKTEDVTTEITQDPAPAKTGTIIVTVTASSNSAPVKDVTFKVEKEGMDPVTIKTDENGVAVTEELVAGEYTVSINNDSIDTKKYETSSYKETFILEGGEILTGKVVLKEKPVITPVPKGDIEVTVTCADDSKPVAGVKISVKPEGSDTVKTIVTSELGVATLAADEGKYVITITEVPKGYDMPEKAEKTVVVKGNETTKESATINKSAPPTPTPTPTPEPTDEPDPTPPGGGGGGGGGGTETPTPTPTPVPLSLDTPRITANDTTIAYGENGLFYIRNMNAVGMDKSDYYVLHIMIPAGLQVKTIAFPGFGSKVSVKLTYESGTTELGTYESAQTVNLTDRQGTSLKYIAFQIHGVEDVNAKGEVQLMVKNISARDRIVTLQAILSIRDSKTAVRVLPDGNKAQTTDRFNVSIEGPKEEGDESGGGDSSGGGSGDTGNETGGNTHPREVITYAQSSVLPYPQLVFDRFNPDVKKIVKAVEVAPLVTQTKPLLQPKEKKAPTVLLISEKLIPNSKASDDLLYAWSKQVKISKRRIFNLLNKQHMLVPGK